METAKAAWKRYNIRQWIAVGAERSLRSLALEKKGRKKQEKKKTPQFEEKHIKMGHRGTKEVVPRTC